MASYTQSNDSSIIGSSYFQGIIKPWDDYVLIPVSDTQSVMVIGKCGGVSGNTISFDDSIVYRLDRGTSYGSTYNTTQTSESSTTVTISEPYYTYSNVFEGSPNLNCTSANSIAAYFVCFCCIVFVINQVIGNVIKSVIKEILPS